jgi:hypothetical protein
MRARALIERCLVAPLGGATLEAQFPRRKIADAKRLTSNQNYGYLQCSSG